MLNTFSASADLLDRVVTIANRYELARKIVDDTFDWFQEALNQKGFRTTIGPGFDGDETTVFVHDALMRDGKAEQFESPIDACRTLDPEKYPFSISEVMDAARELMPNVLVRTHWHPPGATAFGADFIAMPAVAPDVRIRGTMTHERAIQQVRIEQRLVTCQWQALETGFQAGAQEALRIFSSLLKLR